MPSRFQIKHAARVIKSGGVIAYPTEAVFGLGCTPYNANAVERILAIKGRVATKGLILIASDLEQLWPFVAELPAVRAAQIRATWPGHTTWILPARPDAPPWLTGNRDTVATRVTAHPIAKALCQTCKTALISTSANYTGCLPAYSSLQVRQRFRNHIDYLCPGSCSGELRPSRIIHALSGEILRF